MDEYFRAKSKIFDHAKKALINIDGEHGKRLALECPCPRSTCSLTEGDFYAHDVKYRGVAGVSYVLNSPNGAYEIELPLIGGFAVENSLMAGAYALSCGISPETVKDALMHMKCIAGRMERVDIGTDEFSVIIDYAHTPDALEKLLRSVHRLKSSEGHIILVFGCGGERDRGKRRQMAEMASRYSDMVIVTSDNSRGEDKNQIFKDILKGIDKEKPYTVIESRRIAIESAIASAGYGDIVVLAGKGHEKYEIDAEGIHPFDETKIVKSAVRARL